jgi:hypothetical protein
MKFDVAYNERKGIYEVHAQGCKHISMSLERMCTKEGATGKEVAAAYDAENDGIEGTKVGPCAR